MAAVISNKYAPSSGFFQVDVDTNVQTNLHTVKPIVRVLVNKAAYDALHANGKTDIDGVTIGDLITQAFS